MVICYNTGIIVDARVIMVGYIHFRCDLNAVWWVMDNLNRLRLFMPGCIFYAINNCGNKSVTFGVKFVCGD